MNLVSEKEDKSPVQKKRHLSTLISKIWWFLALLIMIYLIRLSYAPIQKIKSLNKLVAYDSTFSDSFDSTYNSPLLTNIIKERVFKESLIKLAENDSINLIVNLKDSTLSLSIKGVNIHQNKIKLKKIDPLFSALSNRTYIKVFSQPLDIREEYSTIVKEPIVERQAPKDAIEASLNAYMPDTLIQNPAFLHMKIDHNINLIFEQEDNPTQLDKSVYLKFKTRYRFKQSWQNIWDFIRLKKQEYQPSIIISMPVNDLRSVYRALPENPKFVLYI